VADILKLLRDEEKYQEDTLNMIASETYPSKAVLEASGNIISNKYSEGYPGKRYYAGTKYVDEIELAAIDEAKKLFGAEHANVQAHSGTQANMAVFMFVLKPGDKILAMDLSCGGHISHGGAFSFTGKFYTTIFYGVDKETSLINFEEVAALAKKHKPKMIIAGFSAYPRKIDFKKFREIADGVGAYLLCDVAHIAGFIAAGLDENPCPYSDFVTLTTHKSLHGPKGGAILCKEEFAKALDRTIFPGIQGGPINGIIAAKAICFQEAQTKEFKRLMQNTIDNSRLICEQLIEKDFKVLTNGSDNHIILLDLSNKDIDGLEAQKELEKSNILVNKNLIPFDTGNSVRPRGVRMGTLGISRRGFAKEDVLRATEILSEILDGGLERKEEIIGICRKYPIYDDS
jgi:glycine hydroxymethyltransferase